MKFSYETSLKTGRVLEATLGAVSAADEVLLTALKQAVHTANTERVEFSIYVEVLGRTMAWSWNPKDEESSGK
jgi:hypothetical protein